MKFLSAYLFLFICGCFNIRMFTQRLSQGKTEYRKKGKIRYRAKNQNRGLYIPNHALPPILFPKGSFILFLLILGHILTEKAQIWGFWERKGMRFPRFSTPMCK